MKDATPFKVVASLSACFLSFLFIYIFFGFSHAYCLVMSFKHGFLEFIWRGTTSTSNINSADSAPYAKVPGRCLVRSKRSLGCSSSRGSWRRLGPSFLCM